MAEDFNFDDWAALYRRDPQAFEAKRQATLALEMARHHAHCGAARDLMMRLESHMDHCQESERLGVAFHFMANSFSRLSDSMADLRATITRAGAVARQSPGH